MGNLKQIFEISKLSLKFKNGSEIKAISSASTGARSEALSLLIVDEAAFIRNIEEIWIASQATLSTGGGAIVLSTPNGVGDWFHEAFGGAESGENEFFPVSLKWDKHPDRDDKWFEVETKNMSKNFRAEYFRDRNWV